MAPEVVLAALKSVTDPDLHADIVALKFVKDVSVDGDRVVFTIESSNPSPTKRAALAAQAREAVAKLPGVATSTCNRDSWCGRSRRPSTASRRCPASRM